MGWRIFIGRIQSGLPLGILDLVQNYAVQTFGEEKRLFCEHGGYLIKACNYDGEAIADEIASKLRDSFEHELTIYCNVLMVQAIMANTLTFMDHPHVIQKAVPFVLPITWEWDKILCSTLCALYTLTPSILLPST